MTGEKGHFLYIPEKGALSQEKTGGLAKGAIRGGDGGTKLCPQEADASPSDIAVDGLKGVVMGDTKRGTRRQADGEEEYAGEHSKGEGRCLARVSELQAQENSKGQVPEHSSCGTSRVKATVRVDFGPYSANREGCRRLECAYSTVHGIDNMLIADEDGNAEVEGSARGGVEAGDVDERGGQGEGNEVGKDDEGKDESVKGEEAPETSGSLGAQLERKLLGTSKPLKLTLVGDDRVLGLLAELLLLLRDGRRDERRLQERELRLLLSQSKAGELVAVEA